MPKILIEDDAVRTGLEIKELQEQLERTNRRLVREIEKRQEKQGFNTLLLNSSPNPVLVIGPDSTVQYVNPAFELLVGFSSSEVVGAKAPYPWWTDDASHKGRKDFLAAVFKGPRKIEERFQTKQGNTIRVEMNSIPVTRDGEPGYALSNWVDVTDQRKAQNELKENHDRLGQIIEFLPDATFVINKEGKIVAWNRAIEKMTGAKAKDMLGKGNYEYALPFYGERRPVLIDIVGQWNKEMEKKYEYIKKEGESLVSETYDPLIKPGSFLWNKASLLYDNNGEVAGAIESIRDITERKVAEKALQESEEKYRLLIETATDAIFIAQDEVLKFTNPKTEEMTGYSAEELAEIPFVDLIHPEDRSVVIERHVKRLKGEEIPNIYSFRILNRSGEELSVELNTIIISWEGRPATLNFLRDITAQKRLEAQLQQAQKMEAVGTLAGGIAHDFNNLLMAIQGRTSIVLMSKDSSHPDFDHLKGIEGHIKSAADLTRQLLGFARGGKYEVRPTNLNELIEKQNRMFGRTKKEIIIHEKYEEDLWSVEIDRGQIESR